MSIVDEASDQPILAMDQVTARRVLEQSTGHAHEGRVYDYYLGGSSNFAVDREFARDLIGRWPDLPWLARQNRQCLARFVRFQLNQGIRQFVDIGSGLPTRGNVHQIADQVAPGQARVVYVDHDPVATAHAYLILRRADCLDRHSVIQADLLNYERLWEAVIESGRIDPTQPVGLLMAAVLHFVPDDEPGQASDAVAFLRDQVAPGSYLALSHGTSDGLNEAELRTLAGITDDYDAKTTASMLLRSYDKIKSYFGNWELVEPGLVWTAEWNPPSLKQEYIDGDLQPSQSRIMAGAARKPQ